MTSKTPSNNPAGADRQSFSVLLQRLLAAAQQERLIALIPNAIADLTPYHPEAE